MKLNIKFRSEIVCEHCGRSHSEALRICDLEVKMRKKGWKLKGKKTACPPCANRISKENRERRGE